MMIDREHYYDYAEDYHDYDPYDKYHDFEPDREIPLEDWEDLDTQ